jgi:hypothetical protein
MAKFFGKSRSQKRAENNLGVKAGTLELQKNDMFRSSRLHEICKYVENSQYDHLADWNVCSESQDHVPLRKRKPKLIFPFGQLLGERVASKLLGRSTFPKLDIPEDPDTTELMKLLVDASYLRSCLLKAVETFVTHNSVFIRLKVVGGNLKYEYFNPKYCYPEFNDSEELIKIEIKYVYEDHKDLDGDGKAKRKWFKMELGQAADIMYDNPLYSSDQAPTFQEVARADHKLGFVQGVWIRNGYDRHSPDGDGESIVERSMGFIDALNYNLSQADSAVLYGQDPQLMVKGLDEDEIESLIKSSSKGWNLGREGDAGFIEVGGSGVQTGKEHRMDLKKDIQDIARVIMLDPEKIVGSAQSAKAMEVLHGPLIELINQMRPHVEKGIKKLLQKSLATLVLLNQRGEELVFNMPPQYSPISLDIVLSWPPIFPLTTQDKQQIISMYMQLSSGNVLSRETVLKNLLAAIPDIEVDDLELELQRVNTQQQFNTFGF